MGYISDYLDGACDCCIHARENRNGDFYCTCHQDDYFPAAAWDDDDSECPSYKPDPDCFDNDDDDDDCIECPNCGDDAYWNGSEYECDNCGWCGEND